VTSSKTPEQDPNFDGTYKPDSSAPSAPEGVVAAGSDTTESKSLDTPTASLKVDEFTGAAHMSYPIVVPPGRSGLSPQLSINYTSTGGNGWLGVGWDLPVGYIQRRGPRKAVPKYDDTKDVYELNLGGSSQELVPIGSDEYRLRIEGALLKIKYNLSGNYWEVWDKSGAKMRFGYSAATRIGKVRAPALKNDTYRWCLDRVEDPRTNYMEFIYWKDEEQIEGQWVTNQIYLQEIKYNGQVSGSLPHNHRVIFNLESSNRTDPVYNYRGGFKILTRKRLSTIEVKTNDTLVRKYQIQYKEPYSDPAKYNVRSLLSQFTLFGNDAVSSLPPVKFTYQALDNSPGNTNKGFGTAQEVFSWPNPSAWSNVNGNYIQNTSHLGMGIYTDVIDMNGDALPDRVVFAKDSPLNIWTVYLNNGAGFDQGTSWLNPSFWDNVNGNYIKNTSWWGFGTYTDVIDMNGDGLPDRVVFAKDRPFDCWTVYFSNGTTGFGEGESWHNPSVFGRVDGNYIKNTSTIGLGTYTHVIDMNGDGLPDRVVLDKDSPYNTWTVYFNDGTKFGPGEDWPNPSIWSNINGNYIQNTSNVGLGVYTHVIDMNGDGLPDRVVFDKESPYDTWTVYFNNGKGFEKGVNWPNPSIWSSVNGNYIQNTSNVKLGTYTHVIDMNGDGLPDRVVFDKDEPYNTWTVYLNNGSGFGPPLGVDWPNPSAWSSVNGNYIQNTSNVDLGTYTDVIDMNGDGLPDRVVFNKDCDPPNCPWSVYFNKGPFPDLLSKMENGIGGTIEISYLPSTAYEDAGGNKVNKIPFVVQTVNSYTEKDGRDNSYTHKYFYSEASYDPVEAEFSGFRKVMAYQMFDAEAYESMTDTTFHQDYFRKGKVERQILTSKEGHTRQVDNVWVAQDNGNGTKFPRLDETKSTITDTGAPSFNHASKYFYDPYFNVSTENKGTYVGLNFTLDIESNFEYTTCTSILSKPTKITVKNGFNQIVSRKWTDYDCNTGNPTTEEVWKSDSPCPIGVDCTTRNSNNPVISYQYYTSDGTNNLWKITDPRNYTTTLNYEATKTHVYETINYLNHKTTTEYDLGTGNLKKLIPPHLQETSYFIENTYDQFGRKLREIQPVPIGGWTGYTYPSLSDPDNRWGDPYTQHVQKQQHVVGGPSILEHYTSSYFDGMGRTYWVSSTGPDGKSIITETQFDTMGRVWKKFNPRFNTDPPPYPYTEFAYDGLSRVIETAIPDDHDPSGFTYINMTYQGLKKVVTNQRDYSTAYAYDVYQRLVKVEEPTTPTTTFTEYSYDTLGNLTQVRAAKDASGNDLLGAPITTTMTYDSLSKKRTMIDPDMGSWEYDYDKSGNLTYQRDAKSQTITFDYDGLNRLWHKYYPDRTVTFTYDDPAVPNSKGKLTKVSDPGPSANPLLQEDLVLEYDLPQRVKSSQKKIGTDPANWKTFEKTYDSAGRVISITYPGSRTYSYEYDVAGNLLHVKENATHNNVIAYSNFTALGQPRQANFSNSVSTTYNYYAKTGKLHTLLTQKPGTPAYQNLNYQQYDGKGNIISLVDSVNNITHSYIYDSLDRLREANGGGAYPTQFYDYDRIGNIKSKSDVENGNEYIYTYGAKPHALRQVGNVSFQYDNNGNMIQKAILGGFTWDIVYDCDNKPTSITKGSTTVSFTYDGNGQRVKKQSSVSGETFYFGELYEKRGGVEILHLFAGSRRVASIRITDGKNQFYHSNHLGSASFITDSNGDPKEKIEYYPFGTYRDVGSPTGTYDYDPDFPDVYYTYTGQEDDDDLGLYNYGVRLYDPVLGRFISPDRLVQAPENPQSLNRYSYCLNNPLIYVDPSGEFFIIAAIIGAVLGGVSSAIQGGDFGDILKGIAIGAVSGAVGGGVGGIVADLASGLGEVGAAAVGGAAGGMAGGATNAALTGGNIGQGMLIGGISGAIGGSLGIAMKGSDWAIRGLVQVGAGAVIGGTVAELTGGRFLQGAIMGAASGAIAFGVSELVGPYARAEKQARSELREQGLSGEMDGAEERFNQNDQNRDFSKRDAGRQPIQSHQYGAARQIYDRMIKSLSPETKFWTTFDKHGGFKIGPYHFQENVQDFPYSVHFERDIVRNPLGHAVYDVRIP